MPTESHSRKMSIQPIWQDCGNDLRIGLRGNCLKASVRKVLQLCLKLQTESSLSRRSHVLHLCGEGTLFRLRPPLLHVTFCTPKCKRIQSDADSSEPCCTNTGTQAPQMLAFAPNQTPCVTGRFCAKSNTVGRTLHFVESWRNFSSQGLASHTETQGLSRCASGPGEALRELIA